jgi:UDP-N-acetylenolpyruvoylglucosamine reductase
MLSQETLNKLKHMKLTGMVEALRQQETDPSYREMDFQDRLGLLVDWEFSKRQHSRLQRLISSAKFQNRTACVENISYFLCNRFLYFLFCYSPNLFII